MIFKILYCAFLVISLFYPTVPLLGPISLRHFFSILFLILCLHEGGFKLDKFLCWYMAFMLFYLIGALMTGYMGIVVNRFVGTYFASIILYLSTKIMIEKYDSGFLIICLLVALGLLNAVVCIGHFFNNPIADIIHKILRIEMGEKQIDLYEKFDDLHGAWVGGLLGVVASGYFLSATCVLALYNRKGIIQWYNWIVFAVILMGLFLVQERSGLAAGLIFTFIFFALNSVRKPSNLAISFLVFPIAVAIISIYGSNIVSYENMRYSTLGMNDEHRLDYALNALRWVMQNPLGCNYAYYDEGGHYPHNFIANAFLHGGVFGGIILLMIVWKQMKKIFIVFWNYRRTNRYNTLLLVCCCAYMCYTMNSFFHNYSLVSGGEMIFLLWAVISSQMDMEENEEIEEDEEDKEDKEYFIDYVT